MIPMKISEGNKLRVLYFLVFCCTASWLPIFADYLKSRSLSGIEIALLLSITPIMMFLAQPFVGMAADRLGYKKSLVLSLLFSAIAFALFLMEGSFYFLLLNTVVMALFYNTLQPLLDSLSLDLSQRDSKFSYGTLRIAGAAGWAFTGIFVGYFIDEINTSVIFAVSSASLFIAFLFSFLIHAGKPVPKVSDPSAWNNPMPMFKNRTLIILLLCVVLISAGATTIWNFYSIYMKENGASASLVGFGISFQGLCELPFFYFSAVIIHRLGIRTTLLFTVFATAMRLFLYAIVKVPEAAIAIELLHGISWSLFWVVCVESVNKLVPERWRATGQSMLYAAYFGIGAIAGNFWTGYLYDEQLSISTIFLLNAFAITGIGLAMVFALKRNDFSRTSTRLEKESA